MKNWKKNKVILQEKIKLIQIPDNILASDFELLKNKFQRELDNTYTAISTTHTRIKNLKKDIKDIKEYYANIKPSKQGD